MNYNLLKHGAGIYVFEGIDNVGKTTIIQALETKIKNATEFDCISIAFPGNEPKTLGSLVYDIHHNENKYFNAPINEASLQLLHVASHIDLIKQKLLNKSNATKIILMDRYWWSTYVYGITGSLSKEIVSAILAPELLYWNDININRFFLLERNDRERVYDIDKEQAIINNYRELAHANSKSKIINNNLCLQNTVNTIYDDIMGV